MARARELAPDPTTYPDVQAKATRAEAADERRRWMDEGLRRGRAFYDQASDQVGERAGWVAAQVEDFAEARPLASLAAGLIAGVAIGFIVGLLVWDDA